MTRPLGTEYNPFFKKYIDLTPNNHGIDALTETKNVVLSTLRAIPQSKAYYKYAPDKWSINDLIQHIIDTEIVFNYRALAISRGEKQDLPGFDHEEFVEQAKADYKSLDEIINQFEQVRNSSILLFKSLPSIVHENIGSVDNSDLSVRAIAFILSGHCIHHINILKERYL